MKPLSDDEARDRLMAGCGAAVMRALATTGRALTEQDLADRTGCNVRTTRRYALLAVRIGWAACAGAGFVATGDGEQLGRMVGAT